MGVGGYAPPGRFTLGETPVTRCIGGWVGSGTGLDGCGKFPPPGFDPLAVQPIENRYTV